MRSGRERVLSGELDRGNRGDIVDRRSAVFHLVLVLPQVDQVKDVEEGQSSAGNEPNKDRAVVSREPDDVQRLLRRRKRSGIVDITGPDRRPDQYPVLSDAIVVVRPHDGAAGSGWVAVVRVPAHIGRVRDVARGINAIHMTRCNSREVPESRVHIACKSHRYVGLDAIPLRGHHRGPKKIPPPGRVSHEQHPGSHRRTVVRPLETDKSTGPMA